MKGFTNDMPEFDPDEFRKWNEKRKRDLAAKARKDGKLLLSAELANYTVEYYLLERNLVRLELEKGGIFQADFKDPSDEIAFLESYGAIAVADTLLKKLTEEG